MHKHSLTTVYKQNTALCAQMGRPGLALDHASHAACTPHHTPRVRRRVAGVCTRSCKSCCLHTTPYPARAQEGGWGLHQIMQDAEWKLKGIVNGMDYSEWSPQTDVFLQVRGTT